MVAFSVTPSAISGTSAFDHEEHELARVSMIAVGGILLLIVGGAFALAGSGSLRLLGIALAVLGWIIGGFGVVGIGRQFRRSSDRDATFTVNRQGRSRRLATVLIAAGGPLVSIGLGLRIVGIRDPFDRLALASAALGLFMVAVGAWMAVKH